MPCRLVMDLRDRLKAMGVRPRVPGATPLRPDSDTASLAPTHEIAPLDRSLLPPLPRKKVTIEEALPGSWHNTAEGPVFVVERRYALGQMRGPIALGAILQARHTTLWDAGRAPALRHLDARKLLFLDTETTGLSGGTGTYVFLVGVTYFSADGTEVVLRQYFLSDISAERALLHALNELFAQFGAVVTFNGKSFDWPLLETRFIYSRLRCLLKDPPHLDMLGPSRRLWKDKLSSCSLEMLEAHVLGVNRGFDVPGWRIPSLYFDYLRAGHIGHLLPVFTHNEHDLLTLMALTGHVGRILEQPDEIDLQAAECFGIAKLYEELGKYTESLRAYERGLDLDPSPELRGLALRRLSFLYKHLQQCDEAVAIWARLAAEGTHLMFPYLELAKHYEHRVKDYAAAAEHTLLASVRATNAVERAELEHRLNRIKAKAMRKAAEAKVAWGPHKDGVTE